MFRLTGSVLVILFMVAANTLAGEEKKRDHGLFNQQNQVGIRLGIWSNRGDSPLEIDTINLFETNFNDENFFFEAFYGFRLHSMLVGEISLGVVNRGSVTVREEGRENAGNVVLYTILGQGKLYPLSILRLPIHPYLTLGGGIFHGRRTVEFTTGDYFTAGLDEESGTDFSYTVGGGVDWPLGSRIGLELNMRYMSVDFSDRLMTISDYDAFTISVGIKYLYKSGKK